MAAVPGVCPGGAVILREPKGGPDVTLAFEERERTTAFEAADRLSVRGYTARLLLVIDADAFEGATEPPAGVPLVYISDRVLTAAGGMHVISAVAAAEQIARFAASVL